MPLPETKRHEPGLPPPTLENDPWNRTMSESEKPIFLDSHSLGLEWRREGVRPRGKKANKQRAMCSKIHHPFNDDDACYI